MQHNYTSTSSCTHDSKLFSYARCSQQDCCVCFTAANPSTCQQWLATCSDLCPCRSIVGPLSSSAPPHQRANTMPEDVAKIDQWSGLQTSPSRFCHQEQHSVSPPAQNARGQKWLKLKVVTPDGHAMNAPHEPSHTSGLLPKWHQCLPWPTVKRRSLGRLCPASSILPTSQVWRLWPDPLTPTRLWRQHTILSRIIPIAFLAFHRLFFFCLLLQNFAI